MIDALEWRYATKKFDDQKKIDSAKIELIKKAFNLTATSYGLQPLKLVIVKDEKLKQQLFEKSYNQMQLKTASHVLVICIENTIDANFIEENFELQKQIRQAKDEVVKPFRDFLIKDFTNRNEQQIKAWGINQAYLAMGNLLTTCAAEKIDSCPMEGFKAEAYDDILNLHDKGISSALVLPIGYRAEDDKFAGFKKVRRPLEETIIEF
jgi:nitroreductase